MKNETIVYRFFVSYSKAKNQGKLQTSYKVPQKKVSFLK